MAARCAAGRAAHARALARARAFPLTPTPLLLPRAQGLCFATDTTNPPSFYQHLLTVQALSSGAIRYWGDQPDRKANNPVLSTRTNATTGGIYSSTWPSTSGTSVSYGRCGVTATTASPPALTAWKCYDHLNNAYACDAGAIVDPINTITTSTVSSPWTTLVGAKSGVNAPTAAAANKVSQMCENGGNGNGAQLGTDSAKNFGTISSGMYGYCGAYGGQPTPNTVPLCPVQSAYIYTTDAAGNKYISGYMNPTSPTSTAYTATNPFRTSLTALDTATTTPYMGLIGDSGTVPKCFTSTNAPAINAATSPAVGVSAATASAMNAIITASVDESQCTTPVTVTTKKTDDSCYQVYEGGICVGPGLSQSALSPSSTAQVASNGYTVAIAATSATTAGGIAGLLSIGSGGTTYASYATPVSPSFTCPNDVLNNYINYNPTAATSSLTGTNTYGTTYTCSGLPSCSSSGTAATLITTVSATSVMFTCSCNGLTSCSNPSFQGAVAGSCTQGGILTLSATADASGAQCSTTVGTPCPSYTYTCSQANSAAPGATASAASQMLYVPPDYPITEYTGATATAAYSQVGCQLYDSIVGGSSTNPSWLPPQLSRTYTSAGIASTGLSSGLHTGYYYGAVGTATYGASYKCVPCWGGFDSRVTPYKRSTFAYDSLQSQPISTVYGNLGATAQKLGNCASFMKTSTSGTAFSYVFWPEADAVGAVLRGAWANSAWNTAENIWLASYVATNQVHILGVAYSADQYALYAVSHTRLYVSCVAQPARAAPLLSRANPLQPQPHLAQAQPARPRHPRALDCSHGPHDEQLH